MFYWVTGLTTLTSRDAPLVNLLGWSLTLLIIIPRGRPDMELQTKSDWWWNQRSAPSHQAPYWWYCWPVFSLCATNQPQNPGWVVEDQILICLSDMHINICNFYFMLDSMFLTSPSFSSDTRLQPASACSATLWCLVSTPSWLCFSKPCSLWLWWTLQDSASMSTLRWAAKILYFFYCRQVFWTSSSPTSFWSTGPILLSSLWSSFSLGSADWCPWGGRRRKSWLEFKQRPTLLQTGKCCYCKHPSSVVCSQQVTLLWLYFTTLQKVHPAPVMGKKSSFF